MAGSHLHVAAEPQNTVRSETLTELGQAVQGRARRVAHLMRAAFDATDDLYLAMSRGAAENGADDDSSEAVDRVVEFVEMAREAALATCELGERIEQAALDARRSDTARATPGTRPSTAEWDRALAKYAALRKMADAMADGAPGLNEKCDAAREAMDRLIEKTPAPNVPALATKIELAVGRSIGFGELFESHEAAILADLKRLGRGGRS